MFIFLFREMAENILETLEDRSILHITAYTTYTFYREWINFQCSDSVKIAYVISENWLFLKGKNLLQLGVNSFLLGNTPFQTELDVQGGKEKVTIIKKMEHILLVYSPYI